VKKDLTLMGTPDHPPGRPAQLTAPENIDSRGHDEELL